MPLSQRRGQKRSAKLTLHTIARKATHAPMHIPGCLLKMVHVR